MNRSLQLALYSVGALALANVAIAYFTSSNRTGRMPGQNSALDFNDSLLKFNPLAWLVDARAATRLPGTPVPGPQPPQPTFAPLPAPVVTDSSGGTTTYWG